MDAYLHAVVSYYDELFGHLHWFNLAQKQLLQAICDDASEADLRARLDSTLLEITDGANEDQGDFAKLTWEERENGKVKLGPESPDVLARGRVYDKALGEARNNIRIEKFLVMELEKDPNLTDYLSLNLPEVRRLKIACWAATCNLVHMVMGLINCRGEGDKLQKDKFLYRVLNIAVEFGYVELVERLAELVEDVGSKSFFFDNDFEDIYLRGMGKEIKRVDYKSGCLHYYACRDQLEPIDLAAKLGNVEMVNTLLACQKANLWCTKPLHWAAKMGNVEVVNAILGNEEKQFDVNDSSLMTVKKSRIAKRYRYTNTFIRWDGSRIGPFDVVDFTPLQLASLYGHRSVVQALCNDEKGRLRATIENDEGVAALQIATEMRDDEIVKILTDVPEVAKDVKRLYRDRQVHVDAANAILVGAALISSVTFAGWLQPPLAYSPFFGSANLDAGAPAPSGMYPSFVSVEGHPIMKIFWVFNSLSFFFAIATLMVGATAARPPKKETYIGVVVQSLRTSLRLAYALLTVSVACVMGAFASAGFVVLPPIHSYTTVMQATVSIGVMVVFLAWTSSTVFKVLTRMQTKIQRRWWEIYREQLQVLSRKDS
ncbi:unnamed protein product [Sphagnum jensenii]|uniref:PGG domain-containing protein n=1 Tax=Sphagnum jensenii TaxID=128206 RepID=A0ABP0WRB2_9BRYO